MVLKGITLKDAKFEVDKEMTPVARVKDVREAWKEFKTCYTIGDLLREFREFCDGADIYLPLCFGSDALYCEVNGFWNVNEADFRIDIVVDSVIEVDRIYFYWDAHDGFHRDPITTGIDRFIKERKEG